MADKQVVTKPAGQALLLAVDSAQLRKDIPEIRSGDTVRLRPEFRRKTLSRNRNGPAHGPLSLSPCGRGRGPPLEERWEAIEECERRFGDTRLRVSTDNIGLARLKEGLELVRVGAALRPEFAAWRYGDQFGRRRRRKMLRVGLGVGIVGGAVAGGVALGVSAGVGFGSGGWWIWRGIYAGYRRIAYGSPDGIVARVPYDDPERGAQVFPLRRRNLPDVRLGTLGRQGYAC